MVDALSLLGIRELMARAGRLREPFLLSPSRCLIAHGRVFAVHGGEFLLEQFNKRGDIQKD
jgi:hypothetical protein